MAASPDPERPPIGAVLVGGASRRMGRDKATVQLDGRTLGARAVDALAGHGLSVVLLGGTRAHEQALQRPWWPDVEPGGGPMVSLGGLLRQTGRSVISLPCDLPHVSPQHLQQLIAGGTPRLARVACWHGRPAYPVGWWTPGVVPCFAAAAAGGRRSFHEALQPVAVDLEFIELTGIDDVDDPEQLRALGYPPAHD